MLELKNISKHYNVAGNDFIALDNINLKFRKNEFVSILGQSGSGKTTMLNIIGGLDRYSSGDLIINNTSTSTYSDRDWDRYRNHSIGFVFQSYNLISHQSILSNVELALTLSGVNKKERRQRSKEMLEKVGLGEHINKKPTQLSGGQMQRVAIARALINDPDILLADEPTGALDSETSEVIMELLKEIANEKLVIMVTHNPELAEKYSTRIINLRDGHIIDDTMPYEDSTKNEVDLTSNNKTSMSFFTALSLSFNNLLTKKARTILTAFAGSIGIIGISLILSLSTGAQDYINKIQADTLTMYPITIEDKSIDLSSLLELQENNNDNNKDDDKTNSNVITTKNVTTKMLTGMQAFTGTTENNLNKFKKHIENNKDQLEDLTNAIDYGYNINLNLYSKIDDKITKLNPFEYIDNPAENSGFATPSSNQPLNAWEELLGNKNLLESQYNLVEGKWPEKKEELVLFVDKDNQLSDLSLYQLGLLNPKNLKEKQEKIAKGEEVSEVDKDISYDEILNLTFKYIPSISFYENNNGSWVPKEDNQELLEKLYDDALELKIVGIVKPSENSSVESESGKVGYTKELTDYIIENVNSTEIAKEQLDNQEIDVFTKKPFLKPGEEIQPAKLEELPENIKAYVSTLPEKEKKEALINFAAASKNTLEDNLKTLGIVDQASPNFINLYPKDFESKEKIDNFIKDYNSNIDDENNQIKYTDFVGLIMSSARSIIDVISYLLIGFVSISLVVSSIMIGIITYVSVLERTKEIGILKSIGASKKDISRVFNAETIIVGLLSGSLGILITSLLVLPANSIIKSLTGVNNFAVLPIKASLLLILLSVTLTLIAGIIPSRIAAKKDAVEALRTE